MGIFNILISVVIFVALWSYVNEKFVEIVVLQINILNIGSILELIFKPLGLLLGIAGLFQKDSRKEISIIAVTTNVVIILWTIAVRLGFVI